MPDRDILGGSVLPCVAVKRVVDRLVNDVPLQGISEPQRREVSYVNGPVIGDVQIDQIPCV